jgi:hypothetical protein
MRKVVGLRDVLGRGAKGRSPTDIPPLTPSPVRLEEKVLPLGTDSLHPIINNLPAYTRPG